jgi:glucose/arabinose dehydrogenase
MKLRRLFAIVSPAFVFFAVGPGETANEPRREAPVVFGDWRDDAPGVLHKITVDDLPAPNEAGSASGSGRMVRPPAGWRPRAPEGFKVQMLAENFKGPRIMRTAPNGDIFLAEAAAGNIRLLRLAENSDRFNVNEVFIRGLQGPYGIAFYPPGPEPRYIYVGAETEVLRYPYAAGATRPSGPAEKIADIPGGSGHSTRDLAFSSDGATLYVAIGSETNVAEGMRTPAADKAVAVGEFGGVEKGRALVLALDPEGGHRRPYATGLRNCSGLAPRPGSDEIWCAVNERDLLGDNLPPDYATNVKAGAFYGWPWYYIGSHPDPRHAGERPDLADKSATPDVLIQPHSAPLGIAFYDGAQFPAQFKGDAFVALHGSWNRSKLTGYKIIRLRFDNGVPTGEYEDFITGFIQDDGDVRGRPTGVAIASDGSLLVSEDGNGSIWRVSFAGK